LELLDLRRNGEFSNDSNMFVQGLDTRSIHMVTEKIHCQDSKKSTLGRVNLKPTVLQEGEELVQVLQVFLHRLAVDQTLVIHVREDEG
jgi:hypothetical protein